MGTIPANFHVDFKQTEGPVGVPRGFGMERFGAVQERARVIGQLGGQAVDIATDYAAKNKQADLRADALAADARLNQIQTEAEIAAGNTSDPAEIRRIWTEAHTNYSAWVSGKSEENVPNIRWGEQQQELIKHADAIKGGFETKGLQRIAAVGKRDSNAKAASVQRDAEISGSREKIAEAVQVRIDNGTLTPEEGEYEKKTAYLRSDNILAKTNLINIEAMEPDKAATAAKAFENAMMAKEEDGSWAAFEHIPEAERREYVAKAKQAVGAVNYRAQLAKNQESREAFAGFYKWQLENPDEPVTLASVQHLNLPADAQVTILRHSQQAAAEKKKVESKIATDIAVARAAADTSRSLLPEVMAYDRNADPDLKKGFALKSKIDALPDGYSGFLNKIFNEKYGEESSKSVGANTKSYVLGEISSFLIEAEPSGSDAGVAGDFRLGPGRGWSYEQSAKQAAIEQDRFLNWVKTENPTDEQMLEYTTTSPRWKALRDDRNIKTFMAALPGVSKAAPSLSDRLNAAHGKGSVTSAIDLDYLRENYSGKK